MEPWLSITEDARHYPSPHNSQPIKLRPVSPTTAQLYYDLDLGLPAENFGIPFAHVCAGVFLHGLSVVARSHGFEVIERLDLAEMDFGSPDRLHHLGTLHLEPHVTTDADRAARTTFLRRRTSRRPYEKRSVPAEQLAQIERLCAQSGHAFGHTAHAPLVKQIVRVNQSTLFSDLRNDAVHAEIMTWLRFSKDQAASTGDGLSAETMLMPGGLLRAAMSHRAWWDAPVLGNALRAIYLRTMRGVQHLGWMSGPFDGPGDHIEAGRTFLRTWLTLTDLGVSLHPFGTVITNPASHRSFVDAAGIAEPPGTLAWMLFRFGYSPAPPLAHRRPASAMLITSPPLETP